MWLKTLNSAVHYMAMLYLHNEIFAARSQLCMVTTLFQQ